MFTMPNSIPQLKRLLYCVVASITLGYDAANFNYWLGVPVDSREGRRIVRASLLYTVLATIVIGCVVANFVDWVGVPSDRTKADALRFVLCTLSYAWFRQLYLSHLGTHAKYQTPDKTEPKSAVKNEATPAWSRHFPTLLPCSGFHRSWIKPR